MHHGTDATSDGLARALHRIGGLKRLPRTGWLDRGIAAADAESVADHSLRVALLAWLAAAGDPALDRDRVLKLALLHDAAEYGAGDVPPYDPADLVAANDEQAFLDRRHRRSPERQAAKRAAEDAAMTDLLGDLPPTAAAELAGLWAEVRDGTSPEAQFVSQADKLETYLQSREYAAARPGLPVGSFAAEVAEVITHPALVALRDAIATMDLSPAATKDERSTGRS
jgi:putative hydrolase of HD superfamily